MWEKHEIDALKIGLSLDVYWETTPKTFKKYVKAYNNKLQDFLIILDQSNYILGQYIAYAVNEPKKYPKKPIIIQEIKKELNKKQKKDRIVMSDTEMEEKAKEITKLLNGKINGQNNIRQIRINLYS